MVCFIFVFIVCIFYIRRVLVLSDPKVIHTHNSRERVLAERILYNHHGMCNNLWKFWGILQQEGIFMDVGKVEDIDSKSKSKCTGCYFSNVQEEQKK